MAAVKGSVGYVVFLVIGVFILCSILFIVFVITVRGQTTQSRGAVHLSSGVTQ